MKKNSKTFKIINLLSASALIATPTILTPLSVVNNNKISNLVNADVQREAHYFGNWKIQYVNQPDFPYVFYSQDSYGNKMFLKAKLNDYDHPQDSNLFNEFIVLEAYYSNRWDGDKIDGTDLNYEEGDKFIFDFSDPMFTHFKSESLWRLSTAHFEKGQYDNGTSIASRVILPKNYGSYGWNTNDYDCNIFGESSPTEIVISEGTKEIQKSTFSWCEYVKTVYLPSSLVKVYKHAFISCYGLRDIYFYGNHDKLVMENASLEFVGDVTFHFISQEICDRYKYFSENNIQGWSKENLMADWASDHELNFVYDTDTPLPTSISVSSDDENCKIINDNSIDETQIKYYLDSNNSGQFNINTVVNPEGADQSVSYSISAQNELAKKASNTLWVENSTIFYNISNDDISSGGTIIYNLFISSNANTSIYKKCQILLYTSKENFDTDSDIVTDRIVSDFEIQESVDETFNGSQVYYLQPTAGQANTLDNFKIYFIYLDEEKTSIGLFSHSDHSNPDIKINSEDTYILDLTKLKEKLNIQVGDILNNLIWNPGDTQNPENNTGYFTKILLPEEIKALNDNSVEKNFNFNIITTYLVNYVSMPRFYNSNGVEQNLNFTNASALEMNGYNKSEQYIEVVFNNFRSGDNRYIRCNGANIIGIDSFTNLPWNIKLVFQTKYIMEYYNSIADENKWFGQETSNNINFNVSYDYLYSTNVKSSITLQQQSTTLLEGYSEKELTDNTISLDLENIENQDSQRDIWPIFYSDKIKDLCDWRVISLDSDSSKYADKISFINNGITSYLKIASGIPAGTYYYQISFGLLGNISNNTNLTIAQSETFTISILSEDIEASQVTIKDSDGSEIEGKQIKIENNTSGSYQFNASVSPSVVSQNVIWSISQWVGQDLSGHISINQKTGLLSWDDQLNYKNSPVTFILRCTSVIKPQPYKEIQVSLDIKSPTISKIDIKYDGKIVSGNTADPDSILKIPGYSYAGGSAKFEAIAEPSDYDETLTWELLDHDSSFIGISQQGLLSWRSTIKPGLPDNTKRTFTIKVSASSSDETALVYGQIEDNSEPSQDKWIQVKMNELNSDLNSITGSNFLIEEKYNTTDFFRGRRFSAKVVQSDGQADPGNYDFSWNIDSWVTNENSSIQIDEKTGVLSWDKDVPIGEYAFDIRVSTDSPDVTPIVIRVNLKIVSSTTNNTILITYNGEEVPASLPPFQISSYTSGSLQFGYISRPEPNIDVYWEILPSSQTGIDIINKYFALGRYTGIIFWNNLIEEGEYSFDIVCRSVKNPTQSFNGVSLHFTVSKPKANSVTIYNGSLEVRDNYKVFANSGEASSTKFTANISPSGADQEVNWSISEWLNNQTDAIDIDEYGVLSWNEELSYENIYQFKIKAASKAAPEIYSEKIISIEVARPRPNSIKVIYEGEEVTNLDITAHYLQSGNVKISSLVLPEGSLSETKWNLVFDSDDYSDLFWIDVINDNNISLCWSNSLDLEKEYNFNIEVISAAFDQVRTTIPVKISVERPISQSIIAYYDDKEITDHINLASLEGTGSSAKFSALVMPKGALQNVQWNISRWVSENAQTDKIRIDNSNGVLTWDDTLANGQYVFEITASATDGSAITTTFTVNLDVSVLPTSITLSSDGVQLDKSLLINTTESTSGFIKIDTLVGPENASQFVSWDITGWNVNGTLGANNITIDDDGLIKWNNKLEYGYYEFTVRVTSLVSNTLTRDLIIKINVDSKDNNNKKNNIVESWIIAPSIMLGVGISLVIAIITNLLREKYFKKTV